MEPATSDVSFLNLPVEVWGTVFQLLGVKDALSCRLVCSAWRTELDDHFDKWTVHLDQNSPYFQHLLQLKVKEVTILDLKTPVDMDQEGTQILFKHPELLEKLSIPQEEDDDSPRICPENLLLLLNSCGKTIKHLDLHVEFSQDVITDHSYNVHPNGFEFATLESLSLNLDLSSFFLFSHLPIQQLNLFDLMVGLSTMSKIKSLTLIISDLDVSSTILTFIGKNGTNLEVIECDLNPTEDEGPDEDQLPASTIDLALLRQVVSLKKIKIHYDGCHTPMEFINAWSTLLKAQTNLTHLNLKDFISRRILRHVCHNNRNTLTKIELWYLDFDIDLAILNGCMHLKELHLIIDEQEDQTLRNIESLPVGIQKFESKNYLIETEDLLSFFVGHGELVEIILENSGWEGSNGVTAALFALLVINRDLSNNLRKMHIFGFNCSTAMDTTVVKEIFRGLNQELQDTEEEFRYVGISFDRTRGEGGDWSVWEIGTFLSIALQEVE